MAISTWIDVSVFMSSALTSTVAATGISKAAEAVVTTASTAGLSNGDFVVIRAQGMPQVNDRVFRIKSLVANTSFVLEGEDSTNYDTFASGTWQKATMANTLSTLTTVNGSGGATEKIDTTTIHQKQKSNIPGMAEALSYTFDSQWDASNAGLQAANAAYKINDERAFQIRFSNGQFILFFGYVTAPLIPGGSTGGIVTTSVAIDGQGTLTTYAA